MIFKCKLCKETFKDSFHFSMHIRLHKMTPKEYYDKYLKKEGEGICKVCGKPTTFNGTAKGYASYCPGKCAAIGGLKKMERTNLKRYGFKTTFHDKEKIKKSIEDKYGVDNISKLPETIEKIQKTKEDRYGKDYAKKFNEKAQKTNLKKYGTSCSLLNETVSRKTQKTNIEKYGVEVYVTSKDFKNKYKRTCNKKYKAESWPESKKAKKLYHSEDYQNKRKENYYNKTGFYSPFQNPDVYKNIKNRNSKPEKRFSKLLKKSDISFRREFVLTSENFIHYFDFAIFKNGKLKCLVEIDGEYFHGLFNDNPGNLIATLHDYKRYDLVPDKVKFLVIDSKRLDEGLKELQRILPMKYKDWKKEMLRSIPKNIKDAIPKFDKKRILKDWKNLCNKPYIKGANLCISVLLNFCRNKVVNSVDWKRIRTSLYKSPCSLHHLLEGINIFKNVSKLREKFRIKYDKQNIIIFSHHSPEAMLAVCSLNKIYISKEPIDKESLKIIRFLKLNAGELI